MMNYRKVSTKSKRSVSTDIKAFKAALFAALRGQAAFLTNLRTDRTRPA